MTLAKTLDAIRAQMQPGDAVAICRDAAKGRCACNCPGVDEPGSLCLTIEYGDPRTSEEIAAEIETNVQKN